MKSKCLTITLLILPLFFFLPHFASAELTEYELLEPLPLGPGDGLSTKVDASNYIASLFRLALAVAGALAVFRLIYGGFLYMSSDAFYKKSEAKTVISQAFWGLGLTMGAWLLVALILEPEDGAFNFNLSFPEVKLPEFKNPPESTGTGIPMTPEELAADKAVRTQLTGSGIGINADPCTQGEVSGCTNLNGLPEGTIQFLVALKSDCKCTIIVSGGTEGGHRTHGPGKPPVDLSYSSSLKSWLVSKNFINTQTQSGVVTVSSGRQARFYYEPSGFDNSTGDHWHLF